MNNEGCQRQDADDQGGHDVVECVELCLTAQHQRVLDVWEVLQYLTDKIFKAKILSEEINFRKLCGIICYSHLPPCIILFQHFSLSFDTRQIYCACTK